MALLRVGGLNPGKRREELLSNYDGEEPYMPGGYDTPYDGEDPWLPNEYADDYDDGYDDVYDDGYDDDYGDSSRYDDDYGYDDDYDEDDGYDRAPYYDAPDYPQGGGSGNFFDDNDWVTWVLLVLLPPVGIWLLWRRRRYSEAVTAVLSVLALAWMIAILYVLIAKPFKRPSDTTITPQPVGVTATEAPEAEPVEEEAVEAEAELVPTEEVDDLNAVFTVDGTPYYHQNTDCIAIGADVQTNRVSRNSAIEKDLLACPYCMGGQYSDGAWDLVFVDETTEDRSNMKVYCSPYNAFFHTDANCSDIGGSAHEVSLKDALLMAKTACETCCSSAGREVFCTKDGTYYHVNDECSGMRNASHVTYAEARVTGKKRCPKCIGGKDETEEAAAESEGSANSFGTGATYYVYATPNGSYYHIQQNCSGMKNAQQVALSDMLKSGRPACPVCCPDAETVVYGQQGNPYYHSNNSCSGMTKPVQGILVNALAAGLQRCPVCWKTN